MISVKVVLLLLAAAAALAAADELPHAHPRAASYNQMSEEDYAEAKYNVAWNVDDEYNKFGQQEERDGDNTKGSYYVNLPDGRRQTVSYYVDGDSGYVAEVAYEGEAKFPDESSEYKPEPRIGYN